MNHLAAIHVIKSQMKMSEDDYRALLMNLTGKNSCKAMNPRQQALVRAHMDKLALHMGLVPTAKATARRPLSQAAFDKMKNQTDPKERKLWALWGSLGRAGQLHTPGPRGLNAWVLREVGVSAPQFANGAQLEQLIERLKAWQKRKGLALAGQAHVDAAGATTDQPEALAA